MLIADSPRPGRYATNPVVPRSLWARPSGVKSATRRCATALRAAPDPGASAGPLRRLAVRPEACPGWRAAQRDSTIGSRKFPSRDPHLCRERLISGGETKSCPASQRACEGFWSAAPSVLWRLLWWVELHGGEAPHGVRHGGRPCAGAQEVSVPIQTEAADQGESRISEADGPRSVPAI